MTETFNIENFMPDDLNTEINKVCNHLQVALHIIEQKFDLAWHLEKVKKELSKGITTADSLNEEYNFSIINNLGKSSYKESLRFASIYIELAKIAKTQKKYNIAWSFVCKANYQAGIMRGTLTKYRLLDADDIHREMARKGGQTRAAKYDDDKAEVTRLIRELAPKDGWKSPEACLEGIKEKLIESINKRRRAKLGPRPELDPDDHKNFKKILLKWLSFDTKKMKESEQQSAVFNEYLKYSNFTMADPNDLP